MTIHNVGIRTTPYNNILNSNKTCEGRLNRSIFKNIKINDVIIFKNHNNGIERNIKAIVINIINCKSFTDMLNNVGLNNALPYAKNINEGQKIYNSYYSKDKEAKYGVLGIVFKVL